MTYEEYLEFDRLIWKGSTSKRAQKLMEKWQNLSREEREVLIQRKYKEGK